MRIPLVRLKGDQRPIRRWEWLFAPLYYPIILLILIFVILPYLWLYPERHAHVIDVEGTDEEKRKLSAFREHRRRVGIGRRLLERCHIVPFNSPPNGNAT